VSPLASDATTRPGLAYRSHPNPKETVARMTADEKKYGDDTPIESNAQPKNNGAMIRATPLAMIRNEQIILMPPDGGYYRNNSAET
jgi:hypothetical protein